MKKERKNKLENLFEQMIAQERAEYSQKENMKIFYISQMHVNEEEAEEVVNGLINGVSHFTEKLDEFKTGKEEAKTYLLSTLRSALIDKSLEEQYELLKEVLYTLHATSMSTLKNLSEEVKCKEEILENLRNELPITEGADLTEDLIEEMMTLVIQGIEECGTLGIIQLFANKQEETVEDEGSFIKTFENEELLKDLLSNQWDNMKIKNYAALATYIIYQQGYIPELDQGISAESIGVMTAAEIESGNTVKDAKEGRIKWDTAMEILKTIALVATTCLVIYSAVSILACYVTLAFLSPTLFTSLFFIGLGYLTYRGMKAVAENVMEGVQSIAELVIIPAEILRNAVKVLSSWSVSLVNWVKTKFGRYRNEQKENGFSFSQKIENLV